MSDGGEAPVPSSPVDEVVLAVAFEPQAAVLGPRIPELLGNSFAEYSQIQTAPPYQIPQEFESPALGMNPIFEFSQGEPRYWLISEDEVFLLQLQKDYIALNWRRRESPYVKFDALRERFRGVIQSFTDGLTSLGGSFVPLRSELSYINVINPGPLWSRPVDLSNVFKLDFPGTEAMDNFSVGMGKSLRDTHDAWVGRLHLNLNTGFNWMSKEYAVQLTLASRSGELPNRSLEEAFDFFELAHAEANLFFREWLTDDAKEAWGLNK